MMELKVSEMTLEQKIGQLVCVRLFQDEEDKKYVFEMLKKGAVGGIQVRYAWDPVGDQQTIDEIRATAEYPVLICADMESGFPGSKLKIPYQMAIGSTDDENLAYEVARVTAIEAKKAGYSMVWGPIVDLATEGALCKNARCFSDRIEDAIRYGCAMVKGYQDEGMVVTAKHFPGGSDCWMDSHMCPTDSNLSEEELLEKDIQPYIHAMKEVNLSGIMTTHKVFRQIDSERPGTLSPKVLNLIRKQGFDGMIVSDSLAMMSIIKKYGAEGSMALAIAAGCDMVLPAANLTFRQIHEALTKAYHEGVFTEERLNEAVRRVLEAQRKSAVPASATELSEYQKNIVEELNRKSLCAVIRDGVELKLNPATKKLFVLVYETNHSGQSFELVGFNWFYKEQVEKKRDMIKEAFPDAEFILLNEYPGPNAMEEVCRASAEVDEVIFFTFCKQHSYQGSDSITDRIKNLILATMDKTAAVVHMGNPYEIKKFKEAPRIFSGIPGSDCEKYAVMAMKGEFVPTGKIPVKLS